MQRQLIRQKGAALIIVLSLLSISLMVGLSSMQSSQIDERLAGNYKAAAEAQMHAEEVASALYKLILPPSYEKKLWKDFDELSEGFGWSDFESVSDEKYCLNVDGEYRRGVACYVEMTEKYSKDILGLSKGGLYIISMGAVAPSAESSPIAISEPVWVNLIVGASNRTPFSGPLRACEEAEISGGGEIYAYDSISGSKEKDTNYEGILIDVLGTIDDDGGRDDGELELSGGGKVWGGVRAGGEIDISGGGFIRGDIIAGDELDIDGGGVIEGDIFSNDNVEIDGGVKVKARSKVNDDNTTTEVAPGNIEALGDVEVGGGAKVAGHVHAGGEAKISNGTKIGKGHESDVELSPKEFESERCDFSPIVAAGEDENGDSVDAVYLTEAVKALVAGLGESVDFSEIHKKAKNDNIGAGPFQEWELRKDGLWAFDKTYNRQEWVLMAPSRTSNWAGEEVAAVYVEEFKHKNGRLTIKDDVMLVVKDELELGKGGSDLVIDDTASLSIIAQDDVEIAHGVKLDPLRGLNAKGRPAFTLLVAGEEDEDEEDIEGGDVKIEASSELVTSLYAPFSDVTITGGGTLYGSVVAKSVEVSGGGTLAYDKALKEIGAPGGGSGDKPGDPEIVEWK